MRIEGYEYEVTDFDTQDEAQAAATVAFSEIDDLESAEAVQHGDKWIVKLGYRAQRWYL